MAKKIGPKQEPDRPLTVRAAATEKLVRRRPSPCPGIHSEDLTASQFANITGIKIRKVGKYADDRPGDLQSGDISDEEEADESDNDDEDQYDDDHDEESDDEKKRNEDRRRPTSIHSVPSTESRAKLPRIWESDFWQPNSHEAQHHHHHHHNNNNHPTSSYGHAISLSSTSSNLLSSEGGFTVLSASTRGSSMSLSPPIETPYISLLRQNSAHEHSNNPSTFQRGRFEIVLGQDVDPTIAKPIITHENRCVEWKRKRSCTT
ncbi:hypothetical protein EC973_004035 [Apophysomyces ossiformis]|uniref:Uncharacterized protein n=1 Tax=Apophysomyces ossiformis TaxID=679940 RepID=A0A8H7BVE7_9FUNG|nr:hypothetical protein EC973_004035 [Apophysomyces ossiformis]